MFAAGGGRFIRRGLVLFVLILLLGESYTTVSMVTPTPH
jgi:hypothetical protein